MSKPNRAAVDELTKGLADDANLIEAGWLGFKKMEIDDLRLAFFAGAQHLWGSVVSISDEGPTENNAKRLALINKELAEFKRNLEGRRG